MLEAVHTVILSRHNNDPAKVTFVCIGREVTSILANREKNKANKVAAESSQDSEDSIASVAKFFVVLHSEKSVSTTWKVCHWSILIAHIKANWW
jgi:hypothetical protein